jgi:hypothetical protein
MQGFTAATDVPGLVRSQCSISEQTSFDITNVVLQAVVCWSGCVLTDER